MAYKDNYRFFFEFEQLHIYIILCQESLSLKFSWLRADHNKGKVCHTVLRWIRWKCLNKGYHNVICFSCFSFPSHSCFHYSSSFVRTVQVSLAWTNFVSKSRYRIKMDEILYNPSSKSCKNIKSNGILFPRHISTT